MKNQNLVLVSLTAIALSACSLTPAYERPVTSASAVWTEPTQGTPIPANWWTLFGSAELNRLVEKALADNHDLAASKYRIEQSRASLKSARASLFPSISGSAGAGRTEREGGDASDNWSAGASLSYELDLFGATRAGIDAGTAQLKGTQYADDALRLVTAGEVARAYFTLLQANEALLVADNNQKNASETLRIIQARYDAGSVSELELSQQKSSVEQTRASRATAEATVKTAQNALAILIGEVPQSVAFADDGLDKMQIASIDAGVPSELLERRPDIRKAEADLVAANANIGAARAALYPSTSLGLDWTIAATPFADPATTALALAARLAAPIFQGGRLEAGVEQATARQKELIETYRQTVLVAFGEVEDALANLKAATTREAALMAALQNSQKAYDLAHLKYKAGAEDFQTVLTAQNDLFQTRNSYIQSRAARLGYAVDLYKALGGGWNH
jgi:NodT family efflux transporter outer membrane factor (OMF) lipoprotein